MPENNRVEQLRNHADVLDKTRRFTIPAVTTSPGGGLEGTTLELLEITDWLARELAGVCRMVADELESKKE